MGVSVICAECKASCSCTDGSQGTKLRSRLVWLVEDFEISGALTVAMCSFCSMTVFQCLDTACAVPVVCSCTGVIAVEAWVV